MICSKVLFPDPFGPISPALSPGCSCNETRSRIFCAPNDLLISVSATKDIFSLTFPV